MRSRRVPRPIAIATLFLAVVCLAAPAMAQDPLETIKSRGTLLAGVKNDTPPFGFIDSNNQVAGFDVDLVREIAKALGVRVEFVKVTSPTRIPMLISGNVDLVAASMTITPDREKTIDFIDSCVNNAKCLLT